METDKFTELHVKPEIKQAIKDMHLTDMFPIQQQAIPVLLAGKDVIAQAQTGTGKTVTFVIPMLQCLDLDNKWVQEIIIVPTRELALQLYDEVLKVGKHMHIRAVAVYGGVSIDNQIKKIREGAQIVIGTPGRVLDHLDRRTLNLNNVKLVILDEADRMLDMGFIEDIRKILEETPKNRQTALFSATMPEQIVYLAAEYMKPDYVNISVSKDEITVKDIEQVWTPVSFYTKTRTIEKIMQVDNVDSALIFCNTKIGVDKLVRSLRHIGVKAEGIHGNLSQAKRTHVMEQFKAGDVRVLVATDVAARGLDIKGVSHIINYNVPKDPKDYVHRIGRTGRAGKKGKAITFITDRDEEAWGQVRWYVDCDIPRKDYLTKEEIEKLKKSGEERPQQFEHRPRHFEHRPSHGDFRRQSQHQGYNRQSYNRRY